MRPAASAETSKVATRRLRWLAASLALVTVAAMRTGLLAFIQQGEAERQSTRAQVAQLRQAAAGTPEIALAVKVTKTGRQKRMTRTGQVHKCGNAVPPHLSAAVVRAQFAPREERSAA